MTEPDELLAALDFTPSLCGKATCYQQAVAEVKFTCECPPNPVCADHAAFWQRVLDRPWSWGWCHQHKRGCRVSLEEIA